ncbi:14686_t:CDS:2 [Cetraspora pellucida]|uniref:14686_t:CDS:1 n=1 Tax=Cetraspora pellucida TaxID=1433469 RepID=A0A9N9JEY9_9GLOM|nr:14686_t:CDS:2 [Cetraspora pellucida]
MNCLEFDLLESILYEPPNGFYLLDKHLSRLIKSAIYFSQNPNYEIFKNCTTEEFRKTVETKLYEHVKELGENIKQRVRLTVNKDGVVNITSATLNNLHTPALLKEPLRIMLDTTFTSSDNIFLYHKTTNRKTYNEARQHLGLGPIPGTDTKNNIFDALLFNEKNEITECSISNIAVEFFDDDGKPFWKTPDVGCGILPGVMREQLIENGDLIPGVISIEEIKTAQREGRKIKCFNSVRKEFQVVLVDEPLL